MEKHSFSVCVEFAGLMALAPWLLFPTRFPLETAAALGGLVLVWGSTTVLRGEVWPRSRLNGALLFFVPAVGMGILISPLPELTLPKATGLILGLAVFRAVAAARTPLLQRLALAGFVLVGLTILVGGFLGAAWMAKVPAWQAFLERIPQRLLRLPEAPADGIHPNELAGALQLYLPLPVSALLSWRPAWRRLPAALLALGGGALVGGTLLLTQSRGGWVGGAVGLVTLLLVKAWPQSDRRIRRLAVALLLGILLVGGVALAWARPGWLDQAAEAAAGQALDTPVGTITLQGRIELWSRAVAALADFPLTGCGLGTFRGIVQLLYPLRLTAPAVDVAHAHNTLLQVYLDVGLPGLVGYLALLGSAAGLVVGSRGPGAAADWLGPGLLAGLVGLHVYGLTDTLALGSKPALAFWLALGLLSTWSGRQSRAVS